jgi:hypothetical protein
VAEVEEPRLLRVQGQSEPLEALRQHVHHPAGIVLSLEGEHEVIGVLCDLWPVRS